MKIKDEVEKHRSNRCRIVDIRVNKSVSCQSYSLERKTNTELVLYILQISGTKHCTTRLTNESHSEKSNHRQIAYFLKCTFPIPPRVANCVELTAYKHEK